jgi:hypothetical protein
MIRRTVQYPSGEQRWILISQIVHARVAAMLADEWVEPFTGLEPRHILTAAIFRHEDGWREYDSLARIGQRSGRPLDFCEVSTCQLLDIWRSSIQSAWAAGPLASYIVSRHHSSRWLPSFSFRSRDDETHAPLAAEFQAEQEQKQAEWLTQWQAGNAALRSESVARSGVEWLRFFDDLSLWLCRSREEPLEFDVPSGGRLRLERAGEREILTTPWPFRGRCQVINAPARSFPVLPPEELVGARTGRQIGLRWPLVAEPGASA